MHVIALIEDATVIRQILEHLGRCAPPGDGKGIDGSKPPIRELTHHPVTDIA